MTTHTRVLIVANRTAATGALVSAVQRWAESEPAKFHLLVPAVPHGLHRMVDPEVQGAAEARARMEAALPRLTAAAGSEVTGEVGAADPIGAIHDALYAQPFDQIIVSTLPRRASRWLHIDLPSKARGFGLPVTHVAAGREITEPEPELAAAATG